MFAVRPQVPVVPLLTVVSEAVLSAAVGHQEYLAIAELPVFWSPVQPFAPVVVLVQPVAPPICPVVPELVLLICLVVPTTSLLAAWFALP